MAFAQLVQAVPFYKGISLEQIGGRGVRWPEGEAADAVDLGGNLRVAKVSSQAAPDGRTPAAAGSDEYAGRHGRQPPRQTLRLGTYRPIWASPEVEISPSLQFAIPRQQAELSPEDARRLGIAPGETIEVAQLDGSGAAQSGEAGSRAGGKPEGTRLKARAAVRTGVPAGTVFLATGIASDSANALTAPEVEVRKP
jgi:NADH-quinone oxidoreductase subunit G